MRFPIVFADRNREKTREWSIQNNFTQVQYAVACTTHNLLFDRLFLCLRFPFLEDEVLADNALPHISNVLDDGFEVRGCIVRTSDEYVVSLSRGHRRVKWANVHKPVIINIVSTVPAPKARLYFSYIGPRS